MSTCYLLCSTVYYLPFVSFPSGFGLQVMQCQSETCRILTLGFHTHHVLLDALNVAGPGDLGLRYRTHRSCWHELIDCNATTGSTALHIIPWFCNFRSVVSPGDPLSVNTARTSSAQTSLQTTRDPRPCALPLAHIQTFYSSFHYDPVIHRCRSTSSHFSKQLLPIPHATPDTYYGAGPFRHKRLRDKMKKKKKNEN